MFSGWIAKVRSVYESLSVYRYLAIPTTGKSRWVVSSVYDSFSHRYAEQSTVVDILTGLVKKLPEISTMHRLKMIRYSTEQFQNEV